MAFNSRSIWSAGITMSTAKRFDELTVALNNG